MGEGDAHRKTLLGVFNKNLLEDKNRKIALHPHPRALDIIRYGRVKDASEGFSRSFDYVSS